MNNYIYIYIYTHICHTNTILGDFILIGLYKYYTRGFDIDLFMQILYYRGFDIDMFIAILY